MRRVAYDADTQVYTYQDEDGQYWEGAPGNRYGSLHKGMSYPTHPMSFLSRFGKEQKEKTILVPEQIKSNKIKPKN
jgi:hypothetical protein